MLEEHFQYMTSNQIKDPYQTKYRINKQKKGHLKEKKSVISEKTPVAVNNLKGKP